MRLAAVLLLTAAALGLGAHPAGASPLGVSADGTALDGLGVAGVGARLTELDATWVRVDLRWSSIAPTRPARPRRYGDPAYDWSAPDALVRRLARVRIGPAPGRAPRILLSFVGTPRWARSDASAGVDAGDDAAAPRPAAFGDFVHAAARRYRLRVSAYEIRPAPNTEAGLVPQRLAGRLAAPSILASLVRVAVAEVRRADPSPVVVGGLARVDVDDGTPPAAFLRALGRVGLPAATAIGIRLSPSGAEMAASGDDLSLADVPTVLGAVDAAFPARRRPIWITGYGVSSAAGDAAQAAGVAAFLAAAASSRVRCGIWERLLDAESPGSGLFELAGGVATLRPGAAPWGAPPG